MLLTRFTSIQRALGNPASTKARVVGIDPRKHCSSRFIPLLHPPFYNGLSRPLTRSSTVNRPQFDLTIFRTALRSHILNQSEEDENVCAQIPQIPALAMLPRLEERKLLLNDLIITRMVRTSVKNEDGVRTMPKTSTRLAMKKDEDVWWLVPVRHSIRMEANRIRKGQVGNRRAVQGQAPYVIDTLILAVS